MNNSYFFILRPLFITFVIARENIPKIFLESYKNLDTFCRNYILKC